jgi:hypothetical protein
MWGLRTCGGGDSSCWLCSTLCLNALSAWLVHCCEQVSRAEANGGNKVYSRPDELEADYTSGALHPGVCVGVRSGCCWCTCLSSDDRGLYPW